MGKGGGHAHIPRPSTALPSADSASPSSPSPQVASGYAPDSFKMPLYPLPPVVVVLCSLALMGSSLVQSPLYCSLALGFVVMGVPVRRLGLWLGGTRWGARWGSAGAPLAEAG